MGRKSSKPNGNGIGTIVDELKTKVQTSSYTEGKKIRIKCKSEKQKEFIRLIDNNQIVLCSGPAGCGKSYLSIIKALELIQECGSPYDKIYVLTPTVETTKFGVGYLPGSFNDKISMFMNSIYRLFDKILTRDVTQNLIKEGRIEVLGLGYIRGENFDNCILIVDESQNVSVKEMLTILTRIGSNCKMIISGDLMQIDNFRYKEDSGLYHAIQKLKDIDDIGIFEFDENDVVRNSIITEIVKKYYN